MQGERIVNGQVDQGASDNKGMRLDVVLDDYADEPVKDDADLDVEVAYDASRTARSRARSPAPS